MRAFNKGGCNKNCPKKKKERNTLNIHQKKGAKKKGKNNSKTSKTRERRRERQNFVTCDGFRRVQEEEEEEDESSPSFFFLSFAVESPSKRLPCCLAREGRDAKTGRRRSIVVVVVFESRKKEEKCFKLLGTTRRSNSDAFFEVLWLALHRRVWFGSSGTETNSKRDASSGIVDRDRA